MKQTATLSINEIATHSNKTIKFIRREIANKSIVSFKQGNKILVLEKDYLFWKENFENSLFSQPKIKNKIKCKDDVSWIDIKDDMQKIDAWKDNSKIKNFNFIDLFAGAGGLSCGLVMAGLKPIESVEIMPDAVETYKYNFSKITNENIAPKDIRLDSVKENIINSHKNKHINLIAGGFPCQGFSMAGNRVINDPRNSLYEDMLDVVKGLKPDYVLMENVEGLRSMLGGAVEQKIIEDYLNLGYKINVAVLNSADYGVAQLRKRVIFIGNKIGATNYHPKPIYDESNYKTVGDVLTKYLNMGENKGINHIFSKTSDEMKKKIAAIPVGKSLYANYSDAWKKVAWDKPSCTVKENHGGVNIHPIKNRVMTPRELATLQSFPDDFIFKGAKKWQLVQIGNAVPCLLGKALGLAILKSYEEWKDKNERLL